MARVARMEVGLCPCCKVGRQAHHRCAGGTGGAGALAWTGPHRGASQPGAAMGFCHAWINGPVTWTLAGVGCSVARWRPHARPARTDSRAVRGLACSVDHWRGHTCAINVNVQ